MLKLSGWVFVVAGLFIGLTILAYGYFQFYAPDTLEAGYVNDYAQQMETEAAKLPATKKRLENAQKRVEEMAEQWRQVAEQKSVHGSGFIDLTQDPLALTVNAPALRDKIQLAVNRQVKLGGVTVVTGPFVTRPTNDAVGLMNSYFNYDRLPYPVLLFELGQVTVRGTFEQIAKNVQAWSNMPDYFAVADGLSITGTSHQLTATYNVVIVGFPPGKVNGGMNMPLVTGADSSATGGLGTGPRQGPGASVGSVPGTLNRG